MSLSGCFSRLVVSAAAVGLLASTPVASAYEEVEVTNGGTIKGRITYSGSVPTKMIVPDDTETCGKPRKAPQIMVGDDGGVQDAVVYIRRIEKGKPWQDKGPVKLDQKDCKFIPQMLAMNPGPVEIINSDPILHNTHIFYGRRTALNLALPKKGLVIERELERPGILRIECDEHGHMHAAGYVAANPYYAVTDDSGGYEITAVPSGEYTLIIYQRTTGPVEKTVTVEAGGTTNVSVDLSK